MIPKLTLYYILNGNQGERSEYNEYEFGVAYDRYDMSVLIRKFIGGETFGYEIFFEDFVLKGELHIAEYFARYRPNREYTRKLLEYGTDDDARYIALESITCEVDYYCGNKRDIDEELMKLVLMFDQ